MINSALAAGRRALTAPEAQQLCDAYGIPTPKQALGKDRRRSGVNSPHGSVFPSFSKSSRTIFCTKPKRAA